MHRDRIRCNSRGIHRDRIGRSSRITQRREAYRTLRDALEHRLGEVRVGCAVHRSLSTFALGRPLHLPHRKGFAFRLRVALATPRHTQNTRPLPLLLALHLSLSLSLLLSLPHRRTRRKHKATVAPQAGTEEAHKHMTAHPSVLCLGTVWQHTDSHAQDRRAQREGTPQQGETNGVTIEHRAQHTMSTRHHVAHGLPAKHAVRRRVAGGLLAGACGRTVADSTAESRAARATNGRTSGTSSPCVSRCTRQSKTCAAST